MQEPETQSSALSVSLRGIGLTYPGAIPLRALEQVSVDVLAGQVVAIVGQSGCGKTTLLKIAAGLLAPSHGHATISGVDASEARRNRVIGLVFQRPVLLRWRTVRSNILLPFELASGRLDTRTAEREVEHYLANATSPMAGLEEFIDKYPAELSGGMQARVAIARALVYGPKVLLLDEPFGSVDEITRDSLTEEFLTLQRERGITTLLVTHSIREAAFLAHRIVVLTPRPGRVCAQVVVPRGEAGVSWRDSSEFVAFCRDMRERLRGC